jgi:hypothetical protein
MWVDRCRMCRRSSSVRWWRRGWTREITGVMLQALCIQSEPIGGNGLQPATTMTKTPRTCTGPASVRIQSEQCEAYDKTRTSSTTRE